MYLVFLEKHTSHIQEAWRTLRGSRYDEVFIYAGPDKFVGLNKHHHPECYPRAKIFADAASIVIGQIGCMEECCTTRLASVCVNDIEPEKVYERLADQTFVSMS